MKRPSVIQVAGGKKLHCTVLKVLERNEDGSPRTFELLRDDESTDVEEGTAFWIVYAPAEMKARRS